MPHPAAFADAAPRTLALFPLQTVLFPDGLLPLKVFEARYLDMVGRCLREGDGFGVVCLREGTEVRRSGDAPEAFEPAGVIAQVEDVDAPQANILVLRCRGTRRFTLENPRRQDDGLWLADVTELPGDEVLAPEPELQGAAQALGRALQALQEQGVALTEGAPRLEDAGWVANRWCELLPLPLSVKHKLMLLPEPQTRLRLVDDILRQRGLVTG